MRTTRTHGSTRSALVTVAAAAAAAATTLSLLAGASTTATAAPAPNGPRGIADPVGDASPATDMEEVVIRSVGPQHGVLNVRVEFAGRQGIGGGTTVWFDTDNDGGPDLRIQGYRQSEYHLREVTRWFGPGRPSDCGTFSQKGSRAWSVVVTRIARDCLGRGPARVAVHTGQQQMNDHDWLGDAREFHGYRWTA